MGPASVQVRRTGFAAQGFQLRVTEVEKQAFRSMRIVSGLFLLGLPLVLF